MPYVLKGRNVLVVGGARGLGALVAHKFAAEGCNVAINYVSNLVRAKDTAHSIEQQFGVRTFVVQGDAASRADCARIVQESLATLGGLDVIVANAGWTKFTDFKDLHALSEQEWDLSWAVNVKSNLHLLQEAAPTFNKNCDGGVVLMTSSVASLTPSGSSMAYCVTKAAGLHLMRCLASSQGPKIRVNAVLPGFLTTEWGMQFSDEQIQALKEKAVLKQETSLEDCAEAFIAAAKNTSMTGQKMHVDSGLVIQP